MSDQINSTGPGAGLDASEVQEATRGNPTPLSSHSAALETACGSDDAETIANLRQAVAERDAEIRWLRTELRHSERLLLEMTKHTDAKPKAAE